MSRIVVIRHPDDPYDFRYTMFQVTEIWRTRGHEVVDICDPADRVDADLAVLHVDLTRVPEDLHALANSYPRTINGRIKDVTKRRISRNIVEHPMDYDGAVVVKSNYNAAGWREAKLALKERGIKHAKVRTPPYLVYECACDVPDEDWNDPDKVVERFLPERSGDHYVLRYWTFCGDKDASRMVYATEPIVKLANTVKRVFIEEVPEDLRALRHELGFDFGKFDYVVVDGKSVLFDANPTPMLGSGAREPILMQSVVSLADGLDSILARPASAG